MTTHELLGQECLSFTEWHEKSNEIGICEKHWHECNWHLLLDEMDRARDFLTQPLTPEWVEKYLDVEMIIGDQIHFGLWWAYFDLGCFLVDPRDNSIEVKHPSHLFECLPEGITLNYKNVEI